MLAMDICLLCIHVTLYMVCKMKTLCTYLVFRYVTSYRQLFIGSANERVQQLEVDMYIGTCRRSTCPDCTAQYSTVQYKVDIGVG